MLEDAQQLVEGTTDFDIRTKALTRPAYTAPRPGKSGGNSSRASARTAVDSARGLDADAERFGGVRASPVAAGVYGRYKMSLENLSKGEQARQDRLARDEVRTQMREEQYEETQERRNRVRGRNELAKRNLIQFNLEQGHVVREERAEIERKMEERREQVRADYRARAEQSYGGYGSLDARLDAEEQAMQEAVRQQAQTERQARRTALREARRSMAEKNRAMAEMRRRDTADRLAYAFSERDRKRAEGAEDKRAESARALARFADNEVERLTKAAETIDLVQSNHLKAKGAREARRNEKVQRMAALERLEEAEWSRHKDDDMATRRETRNKIFASRYVSREEAIQFDGSNFRKLFAMDDVADAEIELANVEILQRIEMVQQRTDDEIDDDAAGLARSTFAAESVERRERKNREMARENAKLRARIKSKQPAVDDLLDNEAAAVRRREMAAEADARREKEAALAAERNGILRQRVVTAKAATDNDVSDDEVGAARRLAAAESAARKKAEAKRIAQENAALRQRIAATAARTDDDVMDEEAGGARAKMAAQSKANRLAQSAQLAKENAAKRERLKNVKAVVDDDIDDDPAGMARAGYDLHHRGGDAYSS